MNENYGFNQMLLYEYIERANSQNIVQAAKDLKCVRWLLTLDLMHAYEGIILILTHACVVAYNPIVNIKFA